MGNSSDSIAIISGAALCSGRRLLRKTRIDDTRGTPEFRSLSVPVDVPQMEEGCVVSMLFAQGRRKIRLIGLAAAAPLTLLAGLQASATPANLSARSVGRLFPESTNSAQLLLNISGALERDLLLQPNFFATEPLTRVFGGAPVRWHEKVETQHGRVIRVRDGSVSVEGKGWPAMSLVIHEQISTAGSKPLVLEGPASPDQQVSSTVTLRFASGPGICVCDVRDWMGFETRVVSPADLRGPAADSKGALVYDFAGRESAGQTDSSQPDLPRKSAVLVVRGNAGLGISGRDTVQEITLSEEGRTVDMQDLGSRCSPLSLTAGMCTQDRRLGPSATSATPEPSNERYSSEQMDRLFERPSDVAQLLHNLKIAVDRDLLLQPAFDDDALLMKVFAGSAIERTTSKGSVDGRDVSIRIDDPHFPRMTVALSLGRGADPRALVEINVAAIPTFDICAVRDVFGLGAEVIVDSHVGMRAVGNVDTPREKGIVRYSSGHQLVTDAASRPRQVNREVAFTVKMDSANGRLWPVQDHRIRNRDEVQSVRIWIAER
jgi:hypothetical protein